MLEWRIRQSRNGFMAEYGSYMQEGVLAGYKPGYFMPGFIISKSSFFDTKKQAEKYIAREGK